MKYNPRESMYILLGDEPRTVRSAKKDFGKSIHVISDKCDLITRFMCGVHFHKIRLRYPDIFAMYLLNMARKNPDKLMLVSATQKYKNLLLRIEPLIEHSYIIIK